MSHIEPQRYIEDLDDPGVRRPIRTVTFESTTASGQPSEYTRGYSPAERRNEPFQPWPRTVGIERGSTFDSLEYQDVPVYHDGYDDYYHPYGTDPTVPEERASRSRTRPRSQTRTRSRSMSRRLRRRFSADRAADRDDDPGGGYYVRPPGHRRADPAPGILYTNTKPYGAYSRYPNYYGGHASRSRGSPPAPQISIPAAHDSFSFPALEGDDDILECDFKLLSPEEDLMKRANDEESRKKHALAKENAKLEYERRKQEEVVRLEEARKQEELRKREQEYERQKQGYAEKLPEADMTRREKERAEEREHRRASRYRSRSRTGTQPFPDNDASDGSDISESEGTEASETDAGEEANVEYDTRRFRAGPAPPRSDFTTKSGSTLHILSSKPSRNNGLDDGRTFELEAETEGSSQPLFRWIHIHQEQMNFEAFAAEILGLSGLTDIQKYPVNAIFSAIREDKIKSVRTSNNTSVGVMTPSFISQAGFVDMRGKTHYPAGSAFSLGKEGSLATWCAIPYFTYEKYSGLLSASTPADFPSQTLLQVGHSATKKARDLQQTLCQGNTSAGSAWVKVGKGKGKGQKEHCLHVSQLWCLQVDSSLVITCGRMTRDQLHEETLAPAIISGENVNNASALRVIVKHLGTVQWTLDLEKTTTWLDLMSAFHQFWPRRLLFYSKRSTIGRHIWPRIVRNAITTHEDIILELQIGRPIEPYESRARRYWNSESNTLTANASGSDARPDRLKHRGKPWYKKWEHKAQKGVSQQFHVFTWLDRVRLHDKTNGKHPSKSEALSRALSELHVYLATKAPWRERKQYSRVSLRTMEDVISTFMSTGRDLVLRRQGFMDTKLLKDCIVIFNFYFPSDNLRDGQGLVGVFAGALGTACEQMYSRPFLLDNPEIHLIATHFSYLSDLLGSAPARTQERIKVPAEFLKALVHIINALVSQDSQRSYKHISLAHSLVVAGVRTVATSISPTPLFQRQTVLPDDILAFFLTRLCRSGVYKTPDLEPIYQMAVNEIDGDIRRSAFNRAPQPKLGRLRDELNAIKAILTQQKCISEDMKDHVWALREHAFVGINAKVLAPHEMAGPFLRAKIDEYMAGAFAGGSISGSNNGYGGGDMAMAYKHHLLTTLSRSLDERLDWFDEAGEDIEVLKQENMHQIASTRDTRENAIYAFTILSFIFVPLSTVASIFGMNSVDVRDMELGQWAYWAIALPLTILSGIMGLWLTGTLRVWADSWVGGKIWKWFSGGDEDDGPAWTSGRKVARFRHGKSGPNFTVEEAATTESVVDIPYSGPQRRYTYESVTAPRTRRRDRAVPGFLRKSPSSDHMMLRRGRTRTYRTYDDNWR